MNYTKQIIEQALMLNHSSDHVTAEDRDRLSATSFGIDLFQVPQLTRALELKTVYLPKEGVLTEYRLVPLRLHNPYSNVASYRNRLQYIQVPMDKRARSTNDDRVIINNSNPCVIDVFTKQTMTDAAGKEWTNPLNKLHINGFCRKSVVPTKLESKFIDAFNSASFRIRSAHAKFEQLAAADGSDLATFDSYRETMEPLYQAYQATMVKLIQDGMIQVTDVLTPYDTGLTPSLGLDSNSKASNPFLCSSTWLADATHIPVANTVHGYIRIDSSAVADDMNNMLKTGVRELSKDENNDGGGRKESSRIGYISDNFGNLTKILVRHQDRNYVNTKATGSLGSADIFFNSTKNNEVISFKGRYLPYAGHTVEGEAGHGLITGSILIESYDIVKDISLNSSLEVVEGLAEDLDTVESVDFDMDSLLSGFSETVDSDPTSVQADDSFLGDSDGIV